MDQALAFDPKFSESAEVCQANNNSPQRHARLQILDLRNLGHQRNHGVRKTFVLKRSL
jgi:hypothetical protein